MGRFTAAFRTLVTTRPDGHERSADSLANLLNNWGPGTRSTRATNTPTQDTAFRQSAWWAGLRLRADVSSSFCPRVTHTVRVAPLDGGASFYQKQPVANPGPMFSVPWVPGGIGITQFRYGMEMDLGRYGNAVGIIRERNPSSLYITQVEPMPMGTGTSAIVKGNKIVKWRFGTDEYDPKDIWLQSQNTLNGSPLGLSPLAYAAMTMGLYSSSQGFASDWFYQGANPRGVLQNTVREKVSAQVRADAKEQFKQSTRNGDIFITGKEWEWKPSTVDTMSGIFLDQQESSNRDICRYLGVPAAMIDVEVSTGNITYANVTLANLQWLITSMGPANQRSEEYWTANTGASNWTVNFDTSVLLRMDPATSTELQIKQVNAMLRVPSEVRESDNLAPYTLDQLAEVELFARLRKPPPVGTPTDPSDPQPAPTGASTDE